MSTLDQLLAELKEKASAATPGKWRATKIYHYENGSWTEVYAGGRALFPRLKNNDTFTEHPNGAYVARADPQTVLALCEIIRVCTERMRFTDQKVDLEIEIDEILAKLGERG